MSHITGDIANVHHIAIAKKQRKGNSKVHGDEDFSENLESLHPNPHLTKLIKTFQEVFGALSPSLSCKKSVHMDFKPKCRV